MSRLSFKNMILFEDDDLIVINKPPFVSSLADRASPQNILELARDYDPDSTLCHRLDKETSGCLLIAKNANSYKHISTQFENREVKKYYHAIVEGSKDFKNHQVDLPIRVLTTGVARIDRKQGKPSSTIFDTIETYRENSLVDCQPISGRLHQIRVHLKHLKSPIIGDVAYGGRPFLLSNIKRNYKHNSQKEEQPLINRFALHAHRIEVKGSDGNLLSNAAPYPKDFRAVLNQLQKHTKL